MNKFATGIRSYNWFQRDLKDCNNDEVKVLNYHVHHILKNECGNCVKLKPEMKLSGMLSGGCCVARAECCPRNAQRDTFCIVRFKYFCIANALFFKFTQR